MNVRNRTIATSLSGRSQDEQNCLPVSSSWAAVLGHPLAVAWTVINLHGDNAHLSGWFGDGMKWQKRILYAGLPANEQLFKDSSLLLSGLKHIKESNSWKRRIEWGCPGLEAGERLARWVGSGTLLSAVLPRDDNVLYSGKSVKGADLWLSVLATIK